MIRYCVLVLSLCFAAITFGEEVSPAKKFFKALGAPAQPQVTAHWNRFHSVAQCNELLQALAKNYPAYCRLQSLGKSFGGNEMWVMTITDFTSGAEMDRPAFWIDGGIHANEIQSVEVVLYTAWYLLEMRGQNTEVARLLKERVFYLMPMMSPDSRDAHFNRPNNTHSPRTGQRPMDDDRDGLVDEDGPDDLDGDGHITSMRVRDKNGRYKSHPDFPEMLIPAKPGEPGEFRLLGAEGFDNDGDGDVNEDGDGSYDPNRDWGWNWQPPHAQHGAYRYPFSIQENRLVADFIMQHANIAGAQSYHNAGGMILRGPGGKEDVWDAADVRIYDQLGRKGEELLPGYRYMHTAKDLYEVFGGSLDWLQQSRGVFAFTNELFSPFNYFRKPGHDGFFGSDETRGSFDKYYLFNESLVKWHEVEHPQYGKVEIGGLTKNSLRQPPSFLLEEECHRNMAFTLYHADQMPLVRVQSAEVKPLSNDLFQITAIIENTRLCPTHNAADVKGKLTPVDKVSLQGEKLTVLTALIDNDPFFLQPREQARQPATVRFDNLPGHSTQYVRWLVRGAGPYEIELHSIKGGKHRLTVK
jgi:hypothetical protein